MILFSKDQEKYSVYTSSFPHQVQFLYLGDVLAVTIEKGEMSLCK